MSSNEQHHGAGQAEGQAEERTGGVTDTMKDKGSEAKDKTYNTTQQAKEKTAKKAHEAKEKAAGPVEEAKQKAQEGKEKTKGVLQETGEKVKHMAETAADAVKHTLGMGGNRDDREREQRSGEDVDNTGVRHTTTDKETK